MKYKYSSDLKETQWDAVVVGSGLGGLSAAVFLAKAGKKVLVLEKHYRAGGFSHTFKRKDFEWDVGVHYVGQVHQSKALLRRIFDYLTNNKLEWASMGDIYDRVILGEDVFDFKADHEENIKGLIAAFPQEEMAIRKYFQLVRKVSKSSTWFFSEKTMPFWLSKCIGWSFRKAFLPYAHRTTRDVLNSITSNEKLISLLCAQCGNYGLPPGQSSFGIHAMVVDHYSAGGAYPIGGSQVISDRMIEVLESNGGVIALNAAVDKILEQGNRAVGVVMQNGDRILAKKVVSNAGVHTTFRSLLSQGSFLNFHRESLSKSSPSIAHVCLYLGLNKSDVELGLPKHNIWHYADWDIDGAFKRQVEGNFMDSPLFYISFPSSKDPSWAIRKPGTSTIQVICSMPYEAVSHWEQLPWQRRGASYETMKNHLSQKMLEVLFRLFPQIEGCISQQEVSTPLSTQHFTNYAKGEIYGLEHSPKRFDLDWLRPKTRLKGFFLTGQDVVSVGVGGAVFSGLMTAVSITNRNLMWSVLTHKAPKA